MVTVARRGEMGGTSQVSGGAERGLREAGGCGGMINVMVPTVTVRRVRARHTVRREL